MKLQTLYKLMFPSIVILSQASFVYATDYMSQVTGSNPATTLNDGDTVTYTGANGTIHSNGVGNQIIVDGAITVNYRNTRFGAVYAMNGGFIDIGDGSVVNSAGFHNETGDPDDFVGGSGIIAHDGGNIIGKNVTLNIESDFGHSIYAIGTGSAINLTGMTKVNLKNNDANNSFSNAIGVAVYKGQVTVENTDISIVGLNSKHSLWATTMYSGEGKITVGNAKVYVEDSQTQASAVTTAGTGAVLINNIQGDINSTYNNSSAFGFWSFDASSITVLENTDLTIKSQNGEAYGITSGSGNIKLLGSDAKLNVNGVDATGIATINNGIVEVNNLALNVTGTNSAANIQNIVTTGGSSTIMVNNSNLNSNLDGVIVGGGTLNLAMNNTIMKNGSGNAFIISDSVVSPSRLNTIASHSQFSGVATTGNNSQFNLYLNDASVWQVTGHSNLTTLSNNKSTIMFSSPSTGFKVLTVTGDYVGDNGHLIFNTQLGNDLSPTDRLVIQGNATGSTIVTVNNVGGRGDSTLNGIELIKVNGVSSDSAFTQNGRIVAGAYDYKLVKGRADGANSQSWYLVNEAPRSEVGSYLANLYVANNMFNLRLHDRQGETQYIDHLTGEKRVTSLWLRYRFDRSEFNDSNHTNTTSNINTVQIGGDIAQWSSNGLNRFNLGLMAGHGDAQNHSKSSLSQYSSSGDVKGYSVGAYGTWYSNYEDKTGLYVDSWISWTKMKANVKGTNITKERYDIKGLNGSLESGYTYKIMQTENGDSFWLQPKGQIIYSGIKQDEHTEQNGTVVTGLGHNIQTRLGIRAYFDNHDRQNKNDSELQLFTELNWLRNNNAHYVKLDDKKIIIEGAKNIGEIKIGGEGNIAKNTSYWSNIAYQIGNNSYRDISAMVGIKYSF